MIGDAFAEALIAFMKKQETAFGVEVMNIQDLIFKGPHDVHCFHHSTSPRKRDESRLRITS